MKLIKKNITKKALRERIEEDKVTYSFDICVNPYHFNKEDNTVEVELYPNKYTQLSKEGFEVLDAPNSSDDRERSIDMVSTLLDNQIFDIKTREIRLSKDKFPTKIPASFLLGLREYHTVEIEHEGVYFLLRANQSKFYDELYKKSVSDTTIVALSEVEETVFRKILAGIFDASLDYISKIMK